MSNLFRDQYTFEDRKNETQDVFKKSNNNKIPIILIKDPKKSGMFTIKDFKLLAPAHKTLSYLTRRIMEIAKLEASESLFLFPESDPSVLLSPGFMISQIYDKFKHEDGYLYLIYTTENTFGN